MGRWVWMNALVVHGTDFNKGLIRVGSSHGVLALHCAGFDEYREGFGCLDGVVEDVVTTICIRAGVPDFGNTYEVSLQSALDLR